MKNYRDKIYKYYSSNSGRSLSPKTTEGFNVRKPFFDKIINEHFPKDKDIKILEVGSGYGAFGYFIQQNGYKNYIGIDGSISQVKEAKRLGVNIILGNLIEHIKNLADNSIDLLIAIDVIEHFSKEELSSLIDDMNRVVKKDGLIITHQPNGESPFSNSIRYGDFTHELTFTHTSISQIFLSSGFSSVTSYEDKPIGHGLKSYIRLFLWNYLVKPIYKFLLIVESGGVDKNIVLTKNFLTVIKK
jgi:2-polyprenyl-3-methyl-5-hydroxy-6-metoxy-1,4-benzoquinol methylase